MSRSPEFKELFFSKTMDYLDCFLARQENRSGETIKAYRISLTCFYEYVTEVKLLNVMQFKFSGCTYEFVLSYSQYLREEKKLAASTVNQRLAALKSYLKYVSDGNIELLQVYMAVQKVPLLRLQKLQRPIIEREGLKKLLKSPGNSKIGIRDSTILILLFDSAIRASELLGIIIGDISVNISSPSILIHGKGKKQRSVSLSYKTVEHLRNYLHLYHDADAPPDTPLFFTVIHGKVNHMSERNLERVVKKYADKARCEAPELPDSVYPHMIRRSRASGLYQDGVPLEMISAILGHANIEVTKIYAIPSVEQLRDALKKGQVEDNDERLWEGNVDDIRKMFGLN